MAIFRNLDGTMSSEFLLGKSGVTLRQGTGFPSSGSDGDFYFRRGTTNRAYQRVNGTWVQLQSTQRQTKTTSTDYTTTLPDDIIFADCSVNIITLTLGNTSTLAGNSITLKDSTGSANSYNITIVGQSGQLIDGETSYVIKRKYESVTLVSDGTNWFVV